MSMSRIKSVQTILSVLFSLVRCGPVSMSVSVFVVVCLCMDVGLFTQTFSCVLCTQVQHAFACARAREERMKDTFSDAI